MEQPYPPMTVYSLNKIPNSTLLSVKLGINSIIHWFSMFIAERQGTYPPLYLAVYQAFAICIFPGTPDN